MKQTPQQIARQIAEAGCMLEDEEEWRGVTYAAAQAIRNERRGAVYLSPGEIRAALEAISQMTSGNGYEFAEWQAQTCGTHSEWRALLRAEAKLKEAIR